MPITKLTCLAVALSVTLLASAEAERRSTGATVVGVTIGPDGEGVSDARITLSGIGGNSTVTSGPSGEFQMRNISSGAYNVTVSHPDYRLGKPERIIVAGDTHLNLALELKEMGSSAAIGELFGELRLGDGGPAPGIVLTLSGGGRRWETTSNEAGEYRFENVPAGRYRLSVSGQTFAVDTSEEVVINGSARTRRDLILSLQETVQVTGARGEITPTASVPGSSTRVIEAEEIEERDPSSFVTIMRDIPGVAVARAGGVGSDTAAYIRGGASNYALVLIDGLPANDPGGAFDFGKLLPLELGSVEVTRGAASSIYGGALSGVVHLTTQSAGADEKRLFAAGEGGSFSWTRFQGGTSGRTENLDWNVGALHLQTDNEVPNNAFTQTGVAASFGGTLGQDTSARFIFRGETNDVGTPGPTSLIRPDLDASEDVGRLVLGGTFRHQAENTQHTLRGGVSRSNKLSLNPEDSGALEIEPEQGDNIGIRFRVPDFAAQDGVVNDSRRFNFAYQANVDKSRHYFSYGAEIEHQNGEFGTTATSDVASETEEAAPPSGFGPFLERFQQQADANVPVRTNVSGFFQDRVLFGNAAVLTVGGRVEHNGSFGLDAMPRAAFVWNHASGLTLKGSAGIGLKEPSLEQSFGGTFRVQGNPDLLPERSRTLDAGIRQNILSDRLWAEGTVFYHQYLDQIVLGDLEFQEIREQSPFAGLTREERQERFAAIQAGEAEVFDFDVDFDRFRPSYTNLGKTKGQGFELSFGGSPFSGLQFRGDYTFLVTEVLEGNEEFEVGDALPNRPRHQLSLSAQGEFGRVSLGATFLHVGERRAEADFITVALGLTTLEAYSRVDVRTRIDLSNAFEVFVVTENLLDRQYEEILGYPALGRSIRMGLRWDLNLR